MPAKKAAAGKDLLKAPAQYLREHTLNGTESYSHEKAYSLLESVNKMKPLKTYSLHARVDTFKLKSGSKFGSVHQKEYEYRKIDQYYSFKDYADILVLASSHPTTKKKRYEFYRIAEKDIEKIVGLINNVQTKQEQRPVPAVAPPQEPSVAKLPECAILPEVTTSSKVFNKPPETAAIHDFFDAPKEVAQVEVSPAKKAALERYSQFMDKERVIGYDFTCIANDPVHGNRIDDTGSVYMYVAHFAHRPKSELIAAGEFDQHHVEQSFQQAYV